MDWQFIPQRLGAQHAAFSISPLGWPGWELGDLLHKFNNARSGNTDVMGDFNDPM